MSLNLVSPGVKVREVDLTVGRADAANEQVGAIAGPFEIGPVGEPILIETEQDLLKTFGKPLSTDAQYDYWLSASSYLSYGGILRVVRTDGSTLKNATSGTAVKIKSYEDYENNRKDDTTWQFAARNPGRWANNLKVCSIDNAADQIVSIASTAGLSVGMGVTQSMVGRSKAGVGTVTTYTGVIRGIITELVSDTSISIKITDTVDGSGTYAAAEYEQGGSLSFVAPGISTITATSAAGIGTTTISSGTVTDWYDMQTLGLSNSNVYWKSIAPKPGTSQYASERSGMNDEIHVVVIDDTGSVTGVAGNILEKHVNLSKAMDATTSPTEAIYYKDLIANNSQYIFAGAATNTSINAGTSAGTENTFTATTGGAWGLNAQSTNFKVAGAQTFTLISGENYSALGGMAPTLQEVMDGYEVFSNAAEYDINFLINGPSGGSTIFESQAKANKLIAIADSRKDCIACISPHRAGVVNVADSDTQTTNILNFYNGVTSSSYAVFDSGYKYTFDRFTNSFRYVPCNADVAGLMARTSLNQFPWFSPAGSSRGAINGGVKLAYNPSQAQRDLIYPKRINPIVAQSGTGIILFGDRTGLAKASAFDRINVRRLFLTIESSIESAAKDQLFEFNDVITRSNFVNIVEPFLRDVKAKRGVSDFVVICDETNNTPDIIDSNQFKADIFVKPARSINFIGLSFVATRTGVSFEEVVGNV